MELDDLLKLIDHVSKSKVDDFCYETGDMKLRLKKNAAKEAVGNQLSKNPILQGAGAGKSESSDFVNADTAMEASSAQTCISSPLVGIFYAAPQEGEEPFVSVGDHVKKGQTLGIVEAMKLMHEITSEANGTVREICAQNGDAVEYGQKLFVIEAE